MEASEKGQMIREIQLIREQWEEGVGGVKGV